VIRHAGAEVNRGSRQNAIQTKGGPPTCESHGIGRRRQEIKKAAANKPMTMADRTARMSAQPVGKEKCKRQDGETGTKSNILDELRAL
jgi:hypothetical protein